VRGGGGQGGERCGAEAQDAILQEMLVQALAVDCRLSTTNDSSSRPSTGGYAGYTGPKGRPLWWVWEGGWVWGWDLGCVQSWSCCHHEAAMSRVTFAVRRAI
jgi:hypothetical protein